MKKAEKEIRRLISKWKPKLLLQDWTIYLELAAEDSKESFSASTNVDVRYHTATVTIFPPGLKDKDEHEKMIIHELLHIVLGEVSREAESRWTTYENYLDRLEQTIEKLVKIIWQ